VEEVLDLVLQGEELERVERKRYVGEENGLGVRDANHKVLQYV